MDLRRLARGQQCCVRIPGVCNGNPETTVLAHLNGGGMGMKHHNLVAAWSCSSCHAWLDGGYATATVPYIQNSRRDRDLYHLEGIIRTQQELLKMGLAEVIEEWKA